VSSPLIEQGMAALRDGDAVAARRAFELALVELESGEALEGLAEVLYLEREYSASAAHYERAYSVYRRERRNMAAGRAARTLAWITGNVLGHWAVRSGWLARARTILEEAGQDRPERGWLLIINAFTEPDAQVRETLLGEAIAIGRRFGDPDIEFLALAYLGGLFVMTDRVEEGLALSDEALAALCAGEPTELATVDEIFCGLLWACELVNDVPRADQWMRAAAERMQRSNVVAAFCRAHYGGILTAAGRWQEAEVELLEAARHFDQGMSERRAAAVIRLAGLRVRQGRLEEAALLLQGLEQHPDVVPTLAALHLARGDTALARDLLERATEGSDHEVPTVGASTMMGPLLALLVDVYLEQGSVEDAARIARRLDRIAQGQRGPYLRAVAAFAEGRVRIASGRGDARACLHRALEGFVRAQLPMEVARTHLEMARALSERAPEVAIAEARAALQDFERLDAARHADAAGALLRSLGAPIRTGPKGTGGLTRREAEVLQLIGAGLSNPRSRTGCTSPARRSRPTWGTCWPSSACETGPRRPPSSPGASSAGSSGISPMLPAWPPVILRTPHQQERDRENDMSVANEALARSFFQEADRGRTPVELCTPGFTAHFPGPPPMDLEGFDQFEAMFRAAFSNQEHALEDLVGEGDRVAVRLRFEGVHTGDFMGVPASGRHFSVEGTAFLRVANGKVAQLWGFLDQMALLQQIGGLPTAVRPG
jgi:predicted ester cyclase/tetratricopeptide (TPR) repeat protein